MSLQTLCNAEFHMGCCCGNVWARRAAAVGLSQSRDINIYTLNALHTFARGIRKPFENCSSYYVALSMMCAVRDRVII